MIRKHPKRDAALVTLFFVFAGIVGSMLARPNPAALAIYGVLMVHTYLSMKCFFSLVDASDRRQMGVDVALLIIYISLALSLGDAEQFLFVWLALFCFSILKYSLLIGILPHPRLLRRKLSANAAALYLGVITLLFLPMHPHVFGAMFVLFLLPSLYYFAIDPLYRPDRSRK